MTPAALVTGGEGGLAAALQQELSAAGYAVHAPGRGQMDVTSTAAVQSYFAGLERLDLLVCNAGLTRDKLVTSMEPAEFDLVLDTCLTGAFKCARAALKLMSRQRQGHILFIGSFSGWSGPAGQANYAAAKAGLLGLAQSLAVEYGGRNVRVNCLLPGFMETPMTEALAPERKAAFKFAHTLGRFNTPLEAARFAVFLDRHLPHTSGQVFNLDSRVHRQG